MAPIVLFGEDFLSEGGLLRCQLVSPEMQNSHEWQTMLGFKDIRDSSTFLGQEY